MTKCELLKEARTVASELDHWKHNYYVNAADQRCEGQDAAKCCILGAVRLAAYHRGHDVAADVVWAVDDVLQQACPAGGGYTISMWNDFASTTKEDVLGVFDKVIEACA